MTSPTVKRNWVLLGGGQSVNENNKFAFTFQPAFPALQNSYQIPPLPIKAGGLNSLNRKIKNSLRNKISYQSPRMRHSRILPEISKRKVDSKIELLKNDFECSSSSGSYRAEGERIVDESFDFIDKEFKKWKSDSEIYEKSTSSEARTSFRSSSYESLNPETESDSTDPKFLKYRDSQGDVCAVFEKREDSKRSNHVSFNDNVIYVDTFRTKTPVQDRLRYFSAQDQPIYSEIKRRPVSPYNDYSIDKSSINSYLNENFWLDCQVCNSLNLPLESREKWEMCRMCRAYGPDDRKVITRLNPIFQEDRDSFDSGKISPPKIIVSDETYSEITLDVPRREPSHYSTITTATANGNGLKPDPMFEESYGRLVQYKPVGRITKSRKFCMLLLCMILIMSFIAICIGLTIYFD